MLNYNQLRKRGVIRMKLVNYRLKDTNAYYRIGCFKDGKIIDLQESYRQFLLAEKQFGKIPNINKLLPEEPSAFFSLGEEAIERAKAGIQFVSEKLPNSSLMFDRDQVVLGPPQPKPGKIICVGRNYVEHAKEMASDVPEYPVLFAKFPNSLIGPEDQIEKTPLTKKLDYEVELVVIIGIKARFVKREDAYDYVAGYTIGNDTTARDLQKRTPQWLQGKSIDKTTPIGPWIVTKDELTDPDQLRVRTYVNGEKRQASNTEKFIFDIPYLIEFISQLMTLEAGDIILTGTPDGVAAGMDEPKFLQNGDTVTLEIDGIGKLENKVRELNE